MGSRSLPVATKGSRETQLRELHHRKQSKEIGMQPKKSEEILLGLKHTNRLQETDPDSHFPITTYLPPPPSSSLPTQFLCKLLICMISWPYPRDPIFPYLFVLAIARLSHKIQDLVEAGTWKALKFGRGSGPSLSHINFADDPVLIAEAVSNQAILIREVRVMKAKYTCGPNALPDIRLRHHCSNILEVICHVWEDAETNISWTIQNGKDIRFWKDMLIDDIAPLNANLA
ncbi:hypothetical protein L195_g022710 [Trifolium pratense]|uniref:Uncharacterized protein n=1 Tax=Trifolium pratense TaxID=57577 RepID=A0A2K3N8S4_TRIPR|nr:hypothetical protein L195_g022710 [Trifolium pratense]